MWGEIYPEYMDALMPLACLPVEIAGRNRMWRKMVMDGIRQDPDWKNGEYTTEPCEGSRFWRIFCSSLEVHHFTSMKNCRRVTPPISTLRTP
jgi:homoserine acetyltransferase